jgi:hypothetical protein
MSAFGDNQNKKSKNDNFEWMSDPFVADEGVYVKNVKPIYRETDPKEYPRKSFKVKELALGLYVLACSVYVTIDIFIYLLRKLFD